MDSFGPIASPQFSEVRPEGPKLSNVLFFFFLNWTGIYLYNVLRAFLRGGCTQRTGRTGSRGEGSDRRAAAVCLKTASKPAARPPCSRSSCSDSSSPHGAPCPGRPWGNAPVWTACSSARQPVAAFRIGIFSAVHACAGVHAVKRLTLWKLRRCFQKHR